ncbi:MAG: hypothetical protein AMXMBFR46_27000 [Acidimicrobiia bacterium]
MSDHREPCPAPRSGADRPAVDETRTETAAEPTAGERWIASSDGAVLEAELRVAPDGRAAVVLCHPHPHYGGSMRAPLVGELFRVLPARGITALRFNFRGVERSTGTWDEGRGEREDAAAALDALVALVPASTRVVLVGWSFGADMALSLRDPRIAGWCAIAPPLHFPGGDRASGAFAALADDPRPKHLVVGERDDLVPTEKTTAATRTWRSTTVLSVPGADHFFAGHASEVTEAVSGFVLRVASQS